MIYYKQEKFSLAEMHFQKALHINPQSSVLLCHIGVVSKSHLIVLPPPPQNLHWQISNLKHDPDSPLSVVSQVQHALKKSEKALDTLNKAINIDPKNPLCKFHRASVLFANEKYKVRNRPRRSGCTADVSLNPHTTHVP